MRVKIYKTIHFPLLYTFRKYTNTWNKIGIAMKITQCYRYTTLMPDWKRGKVLFR